MAYESGRKYVTKYIRTALKRKTDDTLGRVDEEVTSKKQHTLRAPFSMHSSSLRMAVDITDLWIRGDYPTEEIICDVMGN
jgi:hypothetical protein